MEQQQPSKDERSVVSVRVMEVITAMFFLAIGALVVWDSLRLGNSWGPFGPEPGYFPFYIGLILMFAGGGTALMAMVAKSAKVTGDAAFVTWGRLKSVLMVFMPTLAYVGLMSFVGLYVAAALFISAFMMINGKYHFVRTLPYAVVVPILIFWMFEKWFLVPLPKGPIEAMLGF